MTSNFDDVGEFHEKFGLDNVTHHGAAPRGLPKDAVDFRIDFMQEELDEFTLGMQEDDEAKMADALVDLVYVALGTAHLLGYPWDKIWDAVQKANMQKERASSALDSRSKRGHSLDVVKPDGWEPPNVEGILKSSGWIKCPDCKRVLDKPSSITVTRTPAAGFLTGAWCAMCGYHLDLEVADSIMFSKNS